MPGTHEMYMRRCLELAQLGAGHVAPNPMVGSVLVYNDRIIGEGHHREYGHEHAEVNCLKSVADADLNLVKQSTLYVSLEPCAHFGKTPPCSDLLIQHQIPKVVIGCRDPFEEVNGKGVEKLENAGVEVIIGLLENECREINKRFFTSIEQNRPYIILKWAQTADGKIAGNSAERLHITNEYSNRLVHQWRSEEAAILVGTNTALMDDPSLTNRLWNGKNPVRLVLDLSLRLPEHLQLFDQSEKTLVINAIKQEEKDQIIFKKIDAEKNIVHEIIHIANQYRLQSILVEGGTKLLQFFINEGLWDEARIITNETLTIQNGLDAPLLMHKKIVSEKKMGSDLVSIVKKKD